MTKITVLDRMPEYFFKYFLLLQIEHSHPHFTCTLTLTPKPSSGVWRSLVSVLDWGSRGREFKSHHSDGISQQSIFVLS